jgi:hypothetical protein
MIEPRDRARGGPHDDLVGADLDELLDARLHPVALDQRHQDTHERRLRGDRLRPAGVDRGLVLGDAHDPRGRAAAGAVDERLPGAVERHATPWPPVAPLRRVTA